MKKIKNILVISIIMIFISTSSYASTNEFAAFQSNDMNGYDTDCTSYAVWTFQKLGYNNSFGTNNYYHTNDKGPVLNYIQNLGNNFGFYVMSHGNSEGFTMDINSNYQAIYPNNVKGYWYLVFLNYCESLSNNAFANAFQTTSASGRASMGWYANVSDAATSEWWSHFYPIAGSRDLRSACLSAADQSFLYTPIRIYGDVNWNGYAH